MPDKRKSGIAPSEDVVRKHTGQHPAGMEEPPWEKMIKDVGKRRGTYLDPADTPYLEQYLHPEHNILEDQPLRPTMLRNIPNIPFKKPFNWQDFPSRGETGPNVEGLGRFKLSTEHPDYDSIYDVWDFDTNSYLVRDRPGDWNTGLPMLSKEWLTRKFMQYMGKPFAVYERYPKGTAKILGEQAPEESTMPDKDYGMIRGRK